jgi:hypothetical protein
MPTDVTATLRQQLKDPATPHSAIATLLDAASHEERLRALYSLSRAEQHALYERVAEAEPLTLADLVPATIAPRTEVIHHGKNSLPAFRVFQKRFCRPADGSARLFGYNEGFTRPFIGPGYFVAYETGSAQDANPQWRARGGVVVDYFQVPDQPVVEGWPTVVDNSKGLQTFVFKGMRDSIRKVSAHCAVSAAFQGEKFFNSWFVLVREP